MTRRRCCRRPPPAGMLPRRVKPSPRRSRPRRRRSQARPAVLEVGRPSGSLAANRYGPAFQARTVWRHPRRRRRRRRSSGRSAVPARRSLDRGRCRHGDFGFQSYLCRRTYKRVDAERVPKAACYPRGCRYLRQGAATVGTVSPKTGCCGRVRNRALPRRHSPRRRPQCR